MGEGVASCCVSCSQHFVVLVSENAGTALVWNSNGRCQRLGYGGGINGVYSNINEGWDESSVVHHIPTNCIKLFTLPSADLDVGSPGKCWPVSRLSAIGSDISTR